ncbi:TolC family protein [Alloacidobacterium dinghuense]|uniref:TolC family protein n=1 Tax=Alloacidobacterium dinghuense TaxID=2763107 RepID=A0A7G8BGG3_9BACT|nr:TolC family protein [Alloacidobacterium dinghuense]QNI31633.1 TolC family protein [Alloacidobacterium dinghuense]
MKLRTLIVPVLVGWMGIGCALGQSNPNNSATNPYYGSVQVAPATPEVKQLSIDDAILMGIQNNLALTEARQNQQTAQAQASQTLNLLLPNLYVSGGTGLHQYNLEAEGFRGGLLGEFSSLLPPSEIENFKFVVKVDVTEGHANLSQTLFNWAGWDLYRAMKTGAKAAYYSAQSTRGLVVLNVGTTYLQAIADRAQLDYAESLLKTDETLLSQAVAEHQAGTAANLDELRARVEYQTQQQAVINAENTLQKDEITLKRQIGMDPGQKIQLTDAAPFADLSKMSIEDAKREAYSSRQDYQALIQNLRMAELERKAATHERFPTVNFKGNYGVSGISGGPYHGVFEAAGTIEVPIFQEAKFRGDHDVAEAQLENYRSQMADLRNKIDQQLRDSLLDLQTASDLVNVARSNVDLSTTALEQSTDRFQAGVDDNLPVVQAQSTLAQAQSQYVNSVRQFNQAKLGLARNLGIVDTQYKTYLQGGTPPDVKTNPTAQPQGGR